MAFGKKKHRGIKTLIWVVLFVVIVGGMGGSLYYWYHSKLTQVTTSYQTEIEGLKLEAYTLKKTVWQSKETLSAGTVVDESKVVSTEVSSSTFQEAFFSEEDFGKTLLIDLEPNLPIMKAMVFEEAIEADTREEELKMVLLASNLQVNQFVDIRIGFPTGEDYIVLTKMKVQGIDLATNTLWLWVNEKELLTLSSAIVDAYLNKGTKLYTVTYVAPTIQDEAIPTYPVNLDVLKLIQMNPNILEEAKKGLTDEMRKLLDTHLNLLSDEAATNIEAGLQQEASERSAESEVPTQVTDPQVQTSLESSDTGNPSELPAETTTKEEGQSDFY